MLLESLIKSYHMKKKFTDKKQITNIPHPFPIIITLDMYIMEPLYEPQVLPPCYKFIMNIFLNTHFFLNK